MISTRLGDPIKVRVNRCNGAQLPSFDLDDKINSGLQHYQAEAQVVIASNLSAEQEAKLREVFAED